MTVQIARHEQPTGRRVWLVMLWVAIGVLATVGLSSGPKADAGDGQPVLATGHVTFPVGVSSGQVLAFADPNQGTIVKDTSGAALPTPMISSAQVDSNGDFTLTADPASLPAGSMMPDGSINVEADVVAGAQQMSYFFPAAPISTPTGIKFVSVGDTGSRTPNIEFNMADGMVMNSKYSPTKWLTNNGNKVSATASHQQTRTVSTKVSPKLRLLAASVAANDDDSLGAGCYLVPLDKYYGRPEHFVNVYDDGSADAHVAQDNTATHTLGVGIHGADGVWAPSGTASISRSAGTSAVSTDRQHSWGYWNKVNVQDFHNICTLKTSRKPIGFYDILSADIDGSVQYQFYNNSCGEKAKGDTWNTEQATATTFSAGLDIGPISVSAQTGYGTDENVHYKFLQHGSIRGTSSSGIVNSGSIDSSTFLC